MEPRTLGFSWKGRVWLVLVLGELKLGLREMGPDLGWMWSESRHNSVIEYLNNFNLGGRR